MVRQVGYTSILDSLSHFWFSLAFTFFSNKTDIQTHVRWISSIANGFRTPRPNFLYQLAVYVISFANNDYMPLYFGPVLVLSLFVAAKFKLSHRYIVDFVTKSLSRPVLEQDTNFVTFPIVCSVMLVFMFSLPFTVLLGGNIYLTNFPHNIWKNPTTILVMPFAIALIWVSY